MDQAPVHLSIVIAADNGGRIVTTATPKHFSCHSHHAKTLFLPLPPRQNTFPALSVSPKTLTFHTWSQPGNTWQHLVGTWQHVVTTWQHLGTKNGQQPDQNCSLYIAAPPTKFKFPALFTAETRRIGPVPEINVPDTTPDHHRKFRGPRARQLRLVRIATDRRTDRQTDYRLRHD